MTLFLLCLPILLNFILWCVSLEFNYYLRSLPNDLVWYYFAGIIYLTNKIL
jgi:hypothetical protein